MTRDFAQILAEQAARYPGMEGEDWCKLAFQSEFGPEHLAPGREQVLARLKREWAELEPEAPTRAPEDIGNGLCRFHLNRGEEGLAPLLTERFLLTARRHRGSREGLETRLEQIQRMGLPGMGERLEAYRAAGCPALHHSEGFRRRYQPHYRVIGADLAGYLPVLQAVWELAHSGKRTVVAIDGRCGSGKSWLGALLQELFSCTLIHTDDFFLPMEAREPDWEERPGGNMDFARLRVEVLDRLAAGQAPLCRPYDCAAGQYRPARKLELTALTVVEGSYSHHPQLGDPWDLKVFLTCSPAQQQRRLRRREGEYYSVFETRWIPMEERYFSVCNIEKGSHLCLNTDRLCP